MCGQFSVIHTGRVAYIIVGKSQKRVTSVWFDGINAGRTTFPVILIGCDDFGNGLGSRETRVSDKEEEGSRSY